MDFAEEIKKMMVSPGNCLYNDLLSTQGTIAGAKSMGWGRE